MEATSFAAAGEAAENGYDQRQSRSGGEGA
jgi:hypothetical protein